MKDVKIRKFTEKDFQERPEHLRELPWIVFQHHKTGDPKHIADDWQQRKDTLRKAMETGRYGLLIAIDTRSRDNTIIGFLDYHIIDCFVENTRICFLQNMRVWHPWRKRGIGTELVKAMIVLADKEGCTEIHVAAGEGAETFYERLGFHKKDTFLEAEVKDFFE